MYKPLMDLTEVTLRARSALAEALESVHKIRVAAGHRGGDGPFGAATFFAFDPELTCLRCPRGMAGFFEAAKESRVVSDVEANELEKALIAFGRRIVAEFTPKDAYYNLFTSFMANSEVALLLGKGSPGHFFSPTSFALGANWVDLLYQACLFPFNAEKHLQTQVFSKLSADDEIKFYSQSLWLSWIEAIDLVCVGPWMGMKPKIILEMLTALEQRSNGIVSHTVNDAVFPGRKVTIPVFSRGLQGVVFGVFVDVAKSDRSFVFNTLLDFGGTLGDVYADLRWTQFVEVVESEDCTEEELARHLIYVISPVSKVVVSRSGKEAGFGIDKQDNCWFGYQMLSATAMTQRSNAGFEVSGAHGANIYIEPLTDNPHVSPQLTRLRLETNLIRALNAPVSEAPLYYKDVVDLLAQYDDIKSDDRASIARLRQYFVVSEVEKHWKEGGIRVTNDNLKQFLQRERKETHIKSGFQVTSALNELERIFDRKVKAKKVGNALTLEWYPAP